MTPREIIAEAWAITRREPSLIRWGFTSAFLETLLNLKLISYQVYFLYAYAMTEREAGFFDDVSWLYEHTPPWFFLTIVGTFLLLLGIEFLLPKMATGAIIGLAAKAHRKEEVKGGLVLALYNFLPILAIHEFFIFGGWPMAVTLSSVVLRYVESDLKWMMVGILVFFWLLSNVLRFFSAFAEEAVVIRKAGIFEGIGQSTKLIVSYLSRIVFLLILLFVISLRIIFNAVAVLVIPGLVIGLTLLLTTFLSITFSVIIAGLVGISLVGLAGYFFGYLHVFKQTVWTLTYLELRKEKDLDVIEE